MMACDRDFPKILAESDGNIFMIPEFLIGNKIRVKLESFYYVHLLAGRLYLKLN